MEYGCIAEKLSHSFSAEIHSQLFDYQYELREVAKDELDKLLKSRDFKAINVTIPYKTDVIPYLDHISDIAREIGAVNTVVNVNNELYGYNTDLGGLLALMKYNGIELKNKKVLILGSGGTSKTAVVAAKRSECKQVLCVSRVKRDNCITYEEAKQYHTDAEIIINTTPCGMYPKIGESAMDISPFTKLEAVIDAVYNPLQSKLVCDARSRNIKAVGGLYMLVAQAAFAAEKFVSKPVGEEKIAEIYRNIIRKKQNIVLVGMPGSGKSTVGKILSKDLDKEFVDIDELIIEKTGRTPSEIITKDGEKAFRDIEQEIIAAVSLRQNVIIATGGGAVLRSINTELLRENGRIYFLDRPLESLEVYANRPLSSDRDALKCRYEERYGIYCNCCDVKITDPASKEDAVKMIKEDFFK